MMNQTDYLLYFAPDNASLVVQAVLEELGVGYERRLVDRAAAEQAGPEYRKLNPNGLIPVCVIDGTPVFETAAIILTLAERHGRMAPRAGGADRDRFLSWMFFISNTLHANLRQLFYPQKYAGDDPATQEILMVEATRRLLGDCQILDQAYGASDGPYFCGQSPSVIDIYVALCMRWSQLYPMDRPPSIDLSRFPRLSAMCRALETRPAIIRAFVSDGIKAPFFCNPRSPDGTAGAAV